MNLGVDESRYRELEKEIASDASPVGIDAKKTHILILHLLMEIDARLRRLESAAKSGR